MHEQKKCSKCQLCVAIDRFTFDNRRTDGRGSECRDCTRIRGKKYYSANKERVRKRTDVKDITRYGITMSEYNALLEKQSGVCRICGEPEQHRKRLSIDHNHLTMEVRGLLCSFCNSGLGLFNENVDVIQSAINYNRKYASR